MWFVYVLVPLVVIGVLSALLAFVSLQSLNARICYLAAHAVLSVVLILRLEPSPELWAFVLGPGLLISTSRLIRSVYGGRRHAASALEE